MISELLHKWFGLDPRHCEACDILREQLHRSEAERRELLLRLLDRDKVEPSPIEKETQVPIQPQFIPWRVRKEMLEAEDRKQVELMRAKQAEISKLEKELGVS